MIDKNFISLQKAELDKKIYRIIPLIRFKEILEKKMNTLINPYLWKDQYENLILKSSISIEDTSLTLENTLWKSIYCQCWSTTEESIPMWEIYSSDYESVKVSTTIRKLYNSLYYEYGELYDTFIGRVLYNSDRVVLEYLKKNSMEWIYDKSGLGIAKSLLIKRNIFSHENEVRLIYNSFGRIEHDFVQYQINPNILFDEIVLDSRLSDEKFEENKDSILKLGWEKIVKKSNIYDSPLDFYI